MIDKNNFYALLEHMIFSGECPANVNKKEKYKEFIEKRDSSDFIIQADSKDARYDVEIDLAERIILGEEREYE